MAGQNPFLAGKHPTIRRDEAIRAVLLIVIGLTFGTIFLLSDRPLIIGDRSAVVRGPAVTASAASTGFVHAVDEYGVHIPKVRHVPLVTPSAFGGPPRDLPATPDEVRTLRYGYSINELDILGMPFIPRRQYGVLLYYETPGEFVGVPAVDYNLRMAGIPVAAPLGAWDFPLWRYIWGWLFLIALLGIGFFELGALRRRREALGII
ncbi:hypothetical protein GCM10009087_44120 [Sphingomonas oligophenolica]|uniref:DUF3592 domain-containing protein n=1 Tax=Sphingomonas oligophenolica TaxID=301154 RepID=A0ABU9XZT3_9SPHN